MIEYFGYKRIIEICKPEQSEDDNRTLDELLQDLNDLVGLFKVKQQVKDLIAYQKVQKCVNFPVYQFLKRLYI